MIVKRVGVMSVAKLMGLLYAALGLIVGVCFALASMVGGTALLASGGSGEAGVGGGMMMGMGLMAIVIAPIFYGLLGFVGGLLSGWLYNVAARYAGGIEIEVQ